MRVTRRSAAGKSLPSTGPLGAELIANVSGLQGDPGAVGWFESSKYPSGVPVAYVASIHEFGYGPIPPRPFMRPTIGAQGGEWAKLFGQAAKAVALGRITSDNAMTQICAKAAGDVAVTISRIQAPPLKPATVAARRRRYADRGKTGNLTKPLVDTAVLVATISYRVGPIE